MSGIEIIGLAASVLQIADLGWRVSYKLLAFSRKIHQASANIDMMSKDIAATGVVLHQLGEELKKDEMANPEKRLGSTTLLHTAVRVANECSTLFRELDGAIDGNSGNKVILGLKQKLQWSYLEPRIELLRLNLERLKSTLALMLNVLIYAEQLRRRPEEALLREQQGLVKAFASEKGRNEKLCHDLNGTLKLLANEPVAAEEDHRDTENAPQETITARQTQSPSMLVSQQRGIDITPNRNPSNTQEESHSRLSGRGPHTTNSTSASRNGKFTEDTKDLGQHSLLVERLIKEVSSSAYVICEKRRRRLHNSVLDLHRQEWLQLSLIYGHQKILQNLRHHKTILLHWKLICEEKINTSPWNLDNVAEVKSRVDSTKGSTLPDRLDVSTVTKKSSANGYTGKSTDSEDFDSLLDKLIQYKGKVQIKIPRSDFFSDISLNEVNSHQSESQLSSKLGTLPNSISERADTGDSGSLNQRHKSRSSAPTQIKMLDDISSMPDISFNPTIIQGPSADLSKEQRDRWPYSRTPPESEHLSEFRGGRSQHASALAAGATRALGEERSHVRHIRNRNASSPSAKHVVSNIGTSPAFSNERSQAHEYDWLDFFLRCGVRVQNCEIYAETMHRQSVDGVVWPPLTPEMLRSVGLEEDDTLKVMKHLDRKFKSSGGLDKVTVTRADGRSASRDLVSGWGDLLTGYRNQDRASPLPVREVVEYDAGDNPNPLKVRTPVDVMRDRRTRESKKGAAEEDAVRQRQLEEARREGTNFEMREGDFQSITPSRPQQHSQHTQRLRGTPTGRKEDVRITSTDPDRNGGLNKAVNRRPEISILASAPFRSHTRQMMTRHSQFDDIPKEQHEGLSQRAESDQPMKETVALLAEWTNLGQEELAQIS